MRIGALSRRTGASERSLRHYEKQGLLHPQRDESSGYREYREDDVRTVRNIRTLLAAGLNTAVIADLLPCMVEDEGELAPGCAGLVTDLNRERDRISAAVAELAASLDVLDTLITAAPPETADDPACAEDDAEPSPVHS
ncbi:MerR family transcriptional regulator [Nocardiopsis sp. CT-R113]|uniref:MerR family transcriptional regulator n=1 Tax=Nocardiopsis codii TaxID=3065942 RepID=A0ABU7KGC2_9ACTN|nr:MerR family transcriptional regulator [Nocardiopsis sp. CT-R113]MEE2040979.1 MerR family transcriptional regulator [Nocardiopsis sp. CT-R113]